MNVNVEKEHVDIDKVKDNFKHIVLAYKKTDKREQKNELLRTVFDHVEITILQKGRGTIPSTFDIKPHLRYNFIIKTP